MLFGSKCQEMNKKNCNRPNKDLFEDLRNGLTTRTHTHTVVLSALSHALKILEVFNFKKYNFFTSLLCFWERTEWCNRTARRSASN